MAAIAVAMGRNETAVGGLLGRGLKRLRELMHASDRGNNGPRSIARRDRDRLSEIGRGGPAARPGRVVGATPDLAEELANSSLPKRVSTGRLFRSAAPIQLQRPGPITHEA